MLISVLTLCLSPLAYISRLWIGINLWTVVYECKEKLSLCLTNYPLCQKSVWGSACIEPHIFLTAAWVGDEWTASRPGRFTPEEKALSIHWIRGWVGRRAGLDDVEKRKFFTLPRLELRPLCRPACSKSLYRLRYTVSIVYECIHTKKHKHKQ
jgi:hypothetical protein